MLMIDSLRKKKLTVSTFCNDDVRTSAGFPPDPLKSEGDGDHVAAILAFLSREVEQSATLLHDLAARLSDNFCAISATDSRDDVQGQLIAATMALQNEDRLQQRLSDLRTALSVLERAFVEDSPDDLANINQAIIDKLRLDETRSAFALSMGLRDAALHLSKVTKEPSVGDVDLF